MTLNRGNAILNKEVVLFSDTGDRLLFNIKFLSIKLYKNININIKS
jgi:hypothetical protein